MAEDGNVGADLGDGRLQDIPATAIFLRNPNTNEYRPELPPPANDNDYQRVTEIADDTGIQNIQFLPSVSTVIFQNLGKKRVIIKVNGIDDIIVERRTDVNISGFDVNIIEYRTEVAATTSEIQIVGFRRVVAA